MDTTTSTQRASRAGSTRRTSARRKANRRARAIAQSAVWTVVLTIAIVVLGVAPALLGGAPSGPTATISVRVGPADTLWSIAESHRIPGSSTDATVDEIRRANGLTASNLTAGAVLRVPSAQSADGAVAAADAETAVR